MVDLDNTHKDVLQAARKQCDLCGISPTSDMRVHAEHVAAFAILAERERCAKIAASHFNITNDDRARFAGAKIADAIPSPTPERGDG